MLQNVIQKSEVEKIRQVLWLEDEPERNVYEESLIREVFEQYGLHAKIVKVKTISEALSYLLSVKFSLILLDQQVRLPGGAGKHEELRWAGLGVFAWIRCVGKLDVAFEGYDLPDVIKNEIESFGFSSTENECLKWNAKQYVCIVTGIAMPKTNKFIQKIDNLSCAKKNGGLERTRVLFKPIDEELFVQYLEDSISKFGS